MTTQKLNVKRIDEAVLKESFYSKYVKRGLDIICAILALTVFSWLYIILIILGAIFMRGNPFFVQKRPGKDEKIFKLVKFRTMDNRKDENGEFLPDEVRLNKYGKFLRDTSLDELPEAFNILIGNMSVVGPRPQLVRDMVFMSDAERKRHLVRPGLSGLAQVNGRNQIEWEEKFYWDLIYVGKISFWVDFKVVVKTVLSAFIKRENITQGDMATAQDLCDYLYTKGLIDLTTYNENLSEAKELLNSRG